MVPPTSSVYLTDQDPVTRRKLYNAQKENRSGDAVKHHGENLRGKRKGDAGSGQKQKQDARTMECLGDLYARPAKRRLLSAHPGYKLPVAAASR